MSDTVEENEFDGNYVGDEKTLQWSAFKEYNHLNALGISLDHDAVKLLIGDAFPVNQDKESKHLELRKLSWQENVSVLFSLLYNNELCSCCSETVPQSHCHCSHTVTAECECIAVATKKEKTSHKWHELLHGFLQKKLIRLSEMNWRMQFLDALSLIPIEEKKNSVTNKELCSVPDILGGQNLSLPDPIYSNFGRLRPNGFYVSSNGLVFSSKIEMMQFNAKMVEMDAKLKNELSMIQHQHNKLKAKAEERKLLSQRTESHEESDQEEPRENLQLNRESNPKDKAERKSGLFASLTASLSAARTGIQGFLEKSSPKPHRHSPQPVSIGDNDDSDDETGKLTQRPNSKVSTVDGIDNHDEFTRQMQEKGGLMYESADRTVQHLSHDALPPPLSLQALQAEDQPKE